MTQRLSDLGITKLERGGHSPGEHQYCLLEAVAHIVQPDNFNDRPGGVDPILRAFGISLNDRLDDADRQRLLPFVERLIGTDHGPELSVKRGLLLAEFVIKTLPTLFLTRLGGHEADLALIQELTIIDDSIVYDETLAVIRMIRSSVVLECQSLGASFISTYFGEVYFTDSFYSKPFNRIFGTAINSLATLDMREIVGNVETIAFRVESIIAHRFMEAGGTAKEVRTDIEARGQEMLGLYLDVFDRMIDLK